MVRLSADNSLLLLVDMQEKFRTVIHEFDRVIDKSCRLVQGTKIMKVPHISTEQYPEGLGNTVPEVAVMLDQTSVYSKTSFSCAQGNVMDAIKASGRKQIIICGIETHVCIMQTAHDLMAEGYEVVLVEDAISSRYPFDHVTAIDRMRMNGVVIGSLEMVLFELLKDAKLPAFKAVAGLVK